MGRALGRCAWVCALVSGSNSAGLKGTEHFAANGAVRMLVVVGRSHCAWQQTGCRSLVKATSHSRIPAEIVAPPMWVLFKVEDGKIVASKYAKATKTAGLDIITWTIERSGRIAEDVLSGGNNYYWISSKDAAARSVRAFPLAQAAPLCPSSLRGYSSLKGRRY